MYLPSRWLSRVHYSTPLPKSSQFCFVYFCGDCPSSCRQASLPSPLSSLLARTLEELCLPASLGPDITAVFQGLHLTDMAATVLDYRPDIIKVQTKGDPWHRVASRNWALHSLPSATTRYEGR